MKTIILASLIAVGLPLAAAQAQDSNAKASPCSVVQQKGSDNSATASAGGLSTSITAGGGSVSGTTTVPGGGKVTSDADVGRTRVTVAPGSSVTVHSSGNGSSAAAVASNGQVTVLSSGNGCVVTIEPKG
jgi:hypothetical protein